MCSIWAKETIRASRGLRVARQTPPARKIMFGSISVVSRWRLIAAAAASALLCLAAVPAEAGCSKSVIMYNASWCPYFGQARAILARNHIRYAVLDATTPQVQAMACLSRASTRRGSSSSAASPAPYDTAASLCSTTWRGNTACGVGSLVPGLSRPTGPSCAKSRASCGTPS